ncbi:MAG: ATP-binding protein [Methanomicrobiales archaeon HGW-Methanomicrobiales-1]|jgi:serine/threonine-protein kinase RsbW|nr:MAG: ATP-binding protein [Methanomicrobiales archaeon HGW-Methanomicrobiales-1]
MMEPTHSCTIDANIHAIPEVSQSLDQAMRVHGFSEEDILDTQLAVEEAITNVIVHGYAKGPGKIVISIHTTQGLAEIQIEDYAPQFNPLTIPEPDISVEIEERKIGGLGVFLIRQVMDDIMYRYEDGKNILVLVKKKMV